MKNKKIALFIDCENISHKHIDKIIDELANYGELHIRKAYGDWTNSSLKGWNEKLFDYSLEPIHQPAYTTTKNATDIKMTVDIMKIMCNHSYINYIALVTSDSDFTPLITEIKSQAIQVIGFGESKTSSILQKACSEFIKVGIVKQNTNLEKNIKLLNILKNAVRHTRDDDDFAYVSEIGSYLKNQNSTTAKNYGNYKSWGDVFRNLKNIFEFKMIKLNNGRETMIVRIR